MADLAQLRAFFKTDSDEEAITRASKQFGMNPAEIADEVGYNVGGKWGNRAGASVDSYQAGMYGLAEAVTGSQWAKRGREKNDAASNLQRGFAADQGAISSFKDIGGVRDFGDYVGGLAIDSAPYLAEAAVGGIAGRALLTGAKAGGLALGRRAASGAGVVAASYPSSVGSILQAQREQAGTTDLGSAAGLGVPFAAANLFGLEGLAGRAGLARNGVRQLDLLQGGKGVAARATATGGVTALSEGSNELFQEGATQFGRMAVDPNETFINPQSKDRFAESFVGGALLGQSAGMGLGGWRRSEAYQREQALLQAQPDGTGGLTTSQGFTDLLRPQQDRVDPLGDLTPDWTTSQGFEDLRRNDLNEVDATGLYPAVDEPALVPMQGQGPARNELLTTPDMPGMDMNPETMPVDFMGTVAGTDPQIDQMNDPGAVIARQNWMAQQERQQAIQKTADETRQAIEQRTKRAEQMNLKGDAAAKALAELDAALQDGTLDDAAYGTALGMLQARKLGEAKSILKQARADIDAAAGAAEIKQAGVDADKQQAAANLAALQAPAKKDSGLAVVTPEAPAATQAVTERKRGAPIPVTATVEIGRAGRKKSVNPVEWLGLVKKASAQEKRRLVRALGGEFGVNPDTGESEFYSTSEPMTGDQIAGAEAEETGVKITRAGVNATLLKFGITPEVVNRFNGFAPETVSAEEVGVTTGGVGDTSGMRVETTAAAATNEGQAFGMVTPTKAQQSQIDAANDMLTEAQAPAKPVEKYDPASDESLAKRQEAADIEIAQDMVKLARSMGGAELQNIAADWNDTKFDGTPEFDRLPPIYQLRILTEVSNQVKETGNEWGPIEAIIRDISSDYVKDQGAQTVSARIERGAQQGVQAPANQRANPSQQKPTDPGQVAWDKLRETQPRMPPFGTLDARQQAQVRDLAQRDMLNLAAANTVVSRINDDVKGVNLPINRDVLDDGTPLATRGRGAAFEFAEVETYVGGMDQVRAQFDQAGIPNALDHVSEWQLSSDKSATAAHGEISAIQGRYTITLNAAKLDDPGYAAEVARHEVGHAVDMAPHGGIYSVQPEMKVRISNGKVFALGAVSAEIINLTKRFTSFKTFLNYPLNISAFPDLNTPDRIQHELFAQIFAIYTQPEGKALLEAEAPIVAKYFKEVLNDVRSSKPVQIPTTTIAEKRTRAFEARPGQRASQSSPGVLGGTARGQSSALASRSDQFRYETGSPKLDKLAKEVGYMFKAWKTAPSWIGLRSMFTEDLVNLAEKTLPSARAYKNLMDTVQVERGRMERDVIRVLQDFRSLGKVEQGVGPASVNTFLRDSTMNKTWGYKPAWAPDAQVDPAMKARYEMLTPEAQKVVQDVFTHGNDTLQQIRAAANENIGAEYDAVIAELRAKNDTDGVKAEEKAKTTALKDFNSLIDERGDWPYAPLKRFGKHVVMGVSAEYQVAKDAGDNKRMQALQRDGDHYYVGFAETKRAAIKMSEEISAHFDGNVATFEKLDGADEFMGGRDVLGAFQRLRKFSRDMSDGSDAKVDERVDTMMRQLYLTLLSETSARKGELHRKGVAGADRDMMRAFATQGRASAHFVASLKTNGKITDHLRDMKQDVSSRLDGREKKQQYYNEIMRRHSMTLEYEPHGLIDKAMAGTSVYMLLTNPSYYLINMTQPGMMSVPLMAGKHGYGNTWQQMMRSAREVAPLLKDGSFSEDDYGSLPADVRQAIEELADKGVIDISLESVLGSFESESDSPTRHLDTAVQKMRNVAQTVEALNRLTTAMAAYRMEKGKTGSHEAAVKYAGEVIYETHGDYSGFNAPRLMRSGIGRLATQFRKFQLIQLSMFARLLNRAFKGASAEERSVAKKALALNLAHLLAMGGVMGLPGFSAIAWMMGKVFDDDEPDDPEATLRRLIGDKDIADLLLKGAPKLAGVDVSGRIGAGGMLSILPYTDIKIDRDGYGDIATGIMGPFIGGMLPRVADGISLIGKGDLWRGSEMLLPAGLANLSKAARFPTEGVTTRNGDVVMSSDDIGALEVLSQAVGLPSKKLTDRQFLSGAQFKADTFYRNRTTQLKTEYTRAFRANDSQAMRELRQDWLDTQAARKKLGYKTQPLSTLLKAPQEQRKRETGAVAGVKVTDTNRRFVEQLAN